MAYTNAEKTDMLRCFYLSNDNCRRAADLYANEYPNRRQPQYRTFSNLHNSLATFGSFSKPKNGNVGDNEEEYEIHILAYFRASPNSSTRDAALELGISRHRIRKILKKHKMKPFKIQLVQKLQPLDFQNRLNFCHWVLNEGRQYLSFILWTDESNFHRNGVFNKHNTHFWDDVNPHRMQEARHQVRFSTNVWIGVVGDHLLGPYFYNGNLNQDRYLNFLQNELQDYLDDLPLNLRRQIWFQHDGAPPHNARQVTNFLNQEFLNNWVGNTGPHLWPPRSPDLTVLDFFVWGFIKNIVYSTASQNLDELTNKIRIAAQQITPAMLRECRHNLIKRAQMCLNNNGGHFEQLL